MPQDAYATGADLRAYLEGAGFSTSDHLDFEAAAQDAPIQWERDVNYIPWLAAPQTRTFDPQGPELGQQGGFFSSSRWGGSNRLRLGAGLLSASSVVVGITPSLAAGRLLVPGSDFWLEPTEAPYANRPYTSIRFAVPQYGSLQSLQITGTWGFQQQLSLDVWNAVRAKGVLLMLPQLIAAQTSGLQGWTEAGVSEQYGVMPYGAQITAWGTQYVQTVARYRRRTIL